MVYVQSKRGWEPPSRSEIKRLRYSEVLRTKGQLAAAAGFSSAHKFSQRLFAERNGLVLLIETLFVKPQALGIDVSEDLDADQWVMSFWLENGDGDIIPLCDGNKEQYIDRNNTLCGYRGAARLFGKLRRKRIDDYRRLYWNISGSRHLVYSNSHPSSVLKKRLRSFKSRVTDPPSPDQIEKELVDSISYRDIFHVEC
jgi:hypothetical protein